MSFAGLKKQFNKANQYMSEKIGGAKGTELDDDFTEMERKIDVTGKLVEELMAKTHELLQPNPVSRSKMTTVNTISKIRGQAKNTLYPQPEGNLADVMLKYGKELGDDSSFGSCLAECGESYKQLADVKYALEDNVKQNFLEPLHHLQTKDLKEVNHHRKKLSGRRLDYDCKKRKQAKGAAAGNTVTEEDIATAEEKFEESKQLAETAMHNLLENDTEQISQLAAFVEAELNYHQQAVDVLQALSQSLQERNSEASSRPRTMHVPKRVTTSKSDSSMYDKNYDNGTSYNMADTSGYSLSPAQPPAYNSLNNSGGGTRRQACCEALYDFDPENEGELGFKEGDVIQLTSRIDENWYEGSVGGQSGFFPTNYVKVLVDI